MDFSQMTQKWSCKPKPDQSARVRDNQRRHRAKTKAYVAELENEVAGMRTRLSEVLEHNARLVSEVEDLRNQLDSRLQARDSTGPSVTPPSPSPPAPVQRRVPVSADHLIEYAEQNTGSSPLPQDITYTTLHIPTALPTPTPSPFRLLGAAPSVSTREARPASGSLPTTHDNGDHCACDGGSSPSLCAPYAISTIGNIDASTLRASCAQLPPPRPGESTIPCATAYGIITQQNYGGHDLSSITHRLRPGFRRAMLEGDDCRVISSVVFAVVDTINSP